MNFKKSNGRRSDAAHIFLLCFFAYGVSYIGRWNYSACMSTMISSGLLTDRLAGWISTAYLACSGGGQLICGFLSRRMSPRLMIGLGLSGVGLCNIAMGSIDIPVLLLPIWGLNGFCNAMLWSPIIRIFIEWLPEDRQASAGVNISASIPIGTVLSYLIPAAILWISPERWRAVFWISGSLILFYAIFWFLRLARMNDYIRTMSERAEERSRALTFDAGKKPSLFRILLCSGLFTAVIASVFMGALKDAVTAWLPTLLSEEFGMPDWFSSLVTVLLPVISLSGAYFAKFLDRRFFHNELRTTGILYGFSALMVAGALLSYLLPPSVSGGGKALLTILFLSLSTAATWGINTMLLTFVPYHFAKIRLSSTVSGTLNCIAYLSAAVCNSLYGSFRLLFGWKLSFCLWMCIALAGASFCIGLSGLFLKRCVRFEKGCDTVRCKS